ncbi:hypothetical protein Acr_11g0000280 [Actinidia rufa]|uniref:Uncharacterized protein n=1 Tax=Actinidia rufa TaxID=165716 RepID=A0A7J0FAI9_9ERIC|nr:hypothetical protein Acr_11g0000280 [Actinidia rufa]
MGETSGTSSLKFKEVTNETQRSLASPDQTVSGKDLPNPLKGVAFPKSQRNEKNFNIGERKRKISEKTLEAAVAKAMKNFLKCKFLLAKIFQK